MNKNSDTPVNEQDNGRTRAVQSLPDAMALATLAAQQRFTAMDEQNAVRSALGLYREAQSVLGREQKLAQSWHTHTVKPLENLRAPTKWPATFEDLLRSVVPGKDQGEREQHFAEYLRSKVDRSKSHYGADPLAAKETLMKDYKAAKLSREAWETTALEFLRYWAARKSEAKSRAGRAGVAAKVKAR